MSESKTDPLTGGRPWQPIATAPESVEVETAIIDDEGQRNTQTLVKRDRVWFFPDFSMYVYYAPTHWREVSSEGCRVAVMTTRLTLETADERARWMSEHDAFLATRRGSLADDLGERADAWADARVLAYRERCAPAPDLGAGSTGMTPREVEIGSGKLRITLEIDEAIGDGYLSREMWIHWGEMAGWTRPFAGSVLSTAAELERCTAEPSADGSEVEELRRLIRTCGGLCAASLDDVDAVGERCAPEPSDGAEGPAIVRHFADLDEKSIWRALVKLGFAPDLAWKGVQEYRLGCAPGPSDATPDPFEPTPGIPTAEEMSTDAATLQAGVDAMRQGSTSEPTPSSGPRVEPEPSDATWRENAAAWVEEHGWNVLLMQARDVRAFARAMRGDASTIADVISETHRRPDENPGDGLGEALTRFSETLDLCAAKSRTMVKSDGADDIWETRARLGRDDVLLFADAFEDLRRLRREPRVDVEALRALLADMEGPDILTHSQACEVLSEAIGDTPSDPAPEPDLDERGWPEELSIRPEPLRSLLADLADGVRPIDREEVSRRIDEALRDPTPEQAEAESMLAAIRQVSIDRLGDVGGGCDLVTDIDSALARGRYFALESRRLRSALSRVDVELGSGNMDRAHEMAREALDAPGSDPDQTWIMTDEATTSGKALFRCSLCGAMNPAPARGHDCAAHLNLRTGPTLRDEPDGGAPTGPGWWWNEGVFETKPVKVYESDGVLAFDLDSGTAVPCRGYQWGGPCLQGSADAITEEVKAQRDRAEAKLDAFTKAVEVVALACEDNVGRGITRPDVIASELRKHLAAAKAD